MKKTTFRTFKPNLIICPANERVWSLKVPEFFVDDGDFGAYKQFKPNNKIADDYYYV